jgi:hypothetical protein
MAWKAKAIGLSLAVLATAGTAVAAPPVLDVGRARAAFSVDLPDGCVLDEGAVRPAFVVFYITCADRLYAGIYVGNAANVEVPRSRVMVTETRWPAQVQAWSADVPEDQVRADAIAASVRARRVKVALG